MNTPIPAGKTYHSIVIGGGHNGLVCAATLARAGKSVLVLEAASQLGGAARNREFAPGYNVSAAAHLLHGLQEDVVRDLDLAGHGLRIAGQNISTHALIANGSPLRLGDRQLSGDGLSDADIAAYARFTETMARYAGALLPVLRMVPPRLSIETWAARIDFMKIAWGIRRLGRADDLLGVEVGRVEDRRSLVAVAPFLVGEGVHREMQEAVEFHFMPTQLPLGGYWAKGFGCSHW